MNKFYINSKRLICSIIFILSSIFVFGFPGPHRMEAIDPVKASEKDTETVTFRIINTTDLHGQINSMNYEQGIDYQNLGLARVYGQIQKAREELPEANSITVDSGDDLFDYTTDYIFAQDKDVIQPIFQAMSYIGYDAITMGNHDFDYGYEYILKQLKGSGLDEIAVVSNVTDSKTGKYPFLENKMITRTMKTSSGKDVEITIGIVGETIPIFSSKTQKYEGVLKAEDMVANTVKQAKKLKKAGADIIVVVAHTGIGPENPEPNYKNVAYAISKIPEVDVVVCGHEHNIFPTTDMTSPYYKLPNVDTRTYLMNGKNVVMAGDRGQAIGVVDLTIDVTNGRKIIGRSTQIRKVTEQNSSSNRMIASTLDPWKDQLMEHSTKVIGELEQGIVLQNYYGLLEDNSSIQLLNDAKMNYAQKYLLTTGKIHQGYPVIAASTYNKYGADSINDFVHIEGKITDALLTQIQPYNNYLYLYKITGAQLKEWLEWSASAYETIGKEITWENETMTDIYKDKQVSSLLSEDWLDNWSHFYVFDGIDYEINPGVEPRYDFSGNKISDSSRVEHITYQGKPVKDEMVFILATNKITLPSQANQGVEKQTIYGSFNLSQTVLSNYVKQLSGEGKLTVRADHNWKIRFRQEQKFVLKLPYYTDVLFRESSWFREQVKVANHYAYYIAGNDDVAVDKRAPYITFTPLNLTPTANPYEIGITVTAASQIKRVYYCKGGNTVDTFNLTEASRLSGDTFSVSENGVYSVYVEDDAGNKTVGQVTVSNFCADHLGSPVVASYTNRKTRISGTGEAGADIVFVASTGTYQGKVDKNGAFTYALPAQPSDSIVKVFVKDDGKNITSDPVSVPVKRTGPNQPIVNAVNNRDGYITGYLNDGDASVIAMIGNTVYVSDQNGKERYRNCTEIYQKKNKIKEIPIQIAKDGYFVMQVPIQHSGETVILYNIDHIFRSSRGNKVKVTETAPNIPVLYTVSNIDKSVSGYIPGASKADYKLTLVLGNKTYQATADKTGKFVIPFQGQLHTGQLLKVTASDKKEGKTRTSAPATIQVKDIDQFISTNSKEMTVLPITDCNNQISGYSFKNQTIYLAILDHNKNSVKNELYRLNTNRNHKFKFALKDKLVAGTTVYFITKSEDQQPKAWKVVVTETLEEPEAD